MKYIVKLKGKKPQEVRASIVSFGGGRVIFKRRRWFREQVVAYWPEDLVREIVKVGK